MKIEKFESVKNCPKCGRGIFHSVGEKECFAKRRYQEKALDSDNVVNEHLIVSCPACGFEWKETCKDAA